MGHAVYIRCLVDIELIFFAYAFKSLYAYRIKFKCHILVNLFTFAKIAEFPEL